MSKIIDLTGQKFGRLIVVEQYGNDGRGEKKWCCVCECGKKTIVLSSNLRTGHTTSCGCYRDDNVKKINITHGMTKTKLYTIWSAMKRRCYQKNSVDYPNYGGRGIFVCDEWRNDFISFYNWSKTHGYKDGLTIDRIDNGREYSPDNCRWVDSYTQANNKRNNRFITYNGDTHTIKQWSRILNVNYYTLYHKLQRNDWSMERVLV